MSTTAAPMPQAPNDQEISRQALILLEAHGLPPTPEHYAVCYHYAAGRDPELVAEVNRVTAGGAKLAPVASRNLYRKYLTPERNQKAVDDAAVGAQKILQEVLRVVGDFSGETKSYNQGVDQYLENISQEFTDESVKEVVKGLINATATLKQSGESMSRKLEASTQEIDALKKNLQQVAAEAQRDFLTGVYNRKAFETLFTERLNEARENKTELCLLMIDIDHFKQFNDRFGHLFGDEVLKIVARTLSDMLKGRDVVARFGGEEFVAVLPSTPIEGALKVADMIRQAIAGKELKRKDTGEVFGGITVSMGVGRLRPADTLESLTKRADDALYKSKQAGRNRVTREA